MTLTRICATLAAAALLSACNLAPIYHRPAPPVRQQWPSGAAYRLEEMPAGLAWNTLITDAKLKMVIEQALANNRDLRAAAANVAAARAQFHIERSKQLPTLAAGASTSISRRESPVLTPDLYSLDTGVSSFEIDLFGRLKNLSKQAFEQYLASEAGSRSTRITLIGETATGYAMFASDHDLLQISQNTLASAMRSLLLTQARFSAGLSSQLDVQEAETVVAQAQSNIESYTTEMAKDRNALELLIGAPVDDALLPKSLSELDVGIGIVPAGLSSTVLLQRPDVLEAEHQLIGANASIGAARAALFPTITLTSAVGLGSTALSSLFTHGAFYWTAAPSASVPLLGGTTRGNFEYAKAQRDYYVAEYEKAVQSAFRDVADALARRGTIDRQRDAQARLVAASDKSYQLADAQYRVGTSTFLNSLTAQRALYAARQTQISSLLADVNNRIALYRAIASDDPH